MKPKAWLIGGFMMAALAGSGTLRADNNNPSIEACAGYAEADAAYDVAVAHAESVSEAAMRLAIAAFNQADAAYEDAKRAALIDTGAGVTREMLAAGKFYSEASIAREVAYESAMKQAKARPGTSAYRLRNRLQSRLWSGGRRSRSRPSVRRRTQN